MVIFSVTTTKTFPTMRVSDFLDGALIYSDYWAEIKLAPAYQKALAPNAPMPFHTLDHPQYALSITDKESGETYELTKKSFADGLQVFANKYPKHYQDFVSGDYDATTSDVYFQCCVFGQVLYG